MGYLITNAQGDSFMGWGGLWMPPGTPADQLAEFGSEESALRVCENLAYFGERGCRPAPSGAPQPEGQR